MKRKARTLNYDSGFMGKLAEALGVDLSKSYWRECSEEGHSFDAAMNDIVWCSICGKTQAEVEAGAAAGNYEYEFIRYLDERRRG